MIKKKFFGLVLLSTFLPFYPSTCLYAAWPISRTPRIEGVVTDVATGQPIENVVLGCDWGQKIATFGGDVSKTDKYGVYVTDKNGKYMVPARSIWHTLPYGVPFGVGFTGLRMSFIHPLYSTKGYGVGKIPKKRRLYDQTFWGYEGKYVMSGGPEEKRIGIEQDGVIRYDVQLQSLEEKYAKSLGLAVDSEEREEEAGRFRGFVVSLENGFYWQVLKKKNVEFDLDEIFKRWDIIAEKFFIGRCRHHLENYNNAKKNIRHIILGEK